MAHPMKREVKEAAEKKVKRLTSGKMTAGALSGIGRLEQTEMQRKVGKPRGEEE